MQDYFREAEKKAEKLKTPSAKVIYFRAKAASLAAKRDMAGAEEAYKSALAISSTKSDDEKGNLATQGCIVRSSFVHFLCNQKRHEEARAFLQECEDYGREHRDAEEAELFQAALEAGIHLSLDTDDEDGAVARIAELEAAATTMRLANRASVATSSTSPMRRRIGRNIEPPCVRRTRLFASVTALTTANPQAFSWARFTRKREYCWRRAMTSKPWGRPKRCWAYATAQMMRSSGKRHITSSRKCEELPEILNRLLTWRGKHCLWRPEGRRRALSPNLRWRAP